MHALTHPQPDLLIERRPMFLARRLRDSLRLLLLLMPLLLATIAEAREMVTVARDQVNMRSGAGTRHEPLWLLDRGYPLQVIGRRGAWMRVRDFERDVGWVYRPLTHSVPHHVVKSAVVNVRSGPSTRTRIVGKLSYGDVVRTVERRPGWVKVRHESGLRGWIARQLLWGW